MTFDLAPLHHAFAGPRSFGRASMPANASLEARGPVMITDESSADILAREKLLGESFGPARFLKTCERLREGRRPAPGLALAAKQDARLIATVRLWPVLAGGHAALMLGPLAVAGHCRSLGLGAAMIEEGLARAKARGWGAVLLVGDAPYYARFGFERRFTERLVMPGPVERERFLGLELAKGALDGAKGKVAAAGARIGASAAALGLPCAA